LGIKETNSESYPNLWNLNSVFRQLMRLLRNTRSICSLSETFFCCCR